MFFLEFFDVVAFTGLEVLVVLLTLPCFVRLFGDGDVALLRFVVCFNFLDRDDFFC